MKRWESSKGITGTYEASEEAHVISIFLELQDRVFTNGLTKSQIEDVEIW